MKIFITSKFLLLGLFTLCVYGSEVEQVCAYWHK